MYHQSDDPTAFRLNLSQGSWIDLRVFENHSHVSVIFLHLSFNFISFFFHFFIWIRVQRVPSFIKLNLDQIFISVWNFWLPWSNQFLHGMVISSFHVRYVRANHKMNLWSILPVFCGIRGNDSKGITQPSAKLFSYKEIFHAQILRNSHPQMWVGKKNAVLLTKWKSYRFNGAQSQPLLPVLRSMHCKFLPR